MKIFYIPDGHRRYADRQGCSLVESYRLGYQKLVEELIEPALALPYVSQLDVFLLSNLNLQRRDQGELEILLRHGEPMLWELVEHCRPLASIRTLGTYLAKNFDLAGPPDKQLNLVLGCTTEDDIGLGEVDVFIRTGGEIRLSGAPRTIIGNYTQFYGIPELHPDLKFEQILGCLNHYRTRYMREAQQTA
jgi:undecaprenyl pyrophosphate synthase